MASDSPIAFERWAFRKSRLVPHGKVHTSKELLVRPEYLDYVIIFNETHLRRSLL